MSQVKNFVYGLFFLSLFSLLPSLNAQEKIACGCESPTPYYYYTPPPTQTQSQEQMTTIPSQTTEKVIRAAIDIGSGATKLRVAEVNLKDYKIEKVLANESFSVQYQEVLSKSPNNTFDEEVMLAGIDAIRKSAEIAKKYNAEKVIAVATASFRKADNSQELIDRIYKETGVKVYVIDQDLEGKLAFNAVLSQGNYKPEELVVWDIGGGSLQLTALQNEDDYHIFRGDVASIHFKDYIIEDIQRFDPKQITTPNPMNAIEMQKATFKARNLAQRVDHQFKERVLQPNVKVVGVGNIFAYGIYPLVEKKSPYDQTDLNQAVINLEGKTDADLGGGDYANVQKSNAILVLGYMQGLGIDQVEVIDVNNADGAMLYQEFWQ